MLILDTMVLEKSLYGAGWRNTMMDPSTEKPRANGTSLSLEKLLISFTLPPFPNSNNSNSTHGREPHVPIGLPQFALHNAGNDSFMTLFALQKLMEPGSTKVPTVHKLHWAAGGGGMPTPVSPGWGPQMAAMTFNGSGTPLMMPAYTGFPFGHMQAAQSLNSSPHKTRTNATYNLSDEFGQMQLAAHGGPHATRSRKISHLNQVDTAG